MSRAGDPEAAAVIWEWRDQAPGVRPASDLGRQRIIGSLQGVGVLLIGTAIFLFWSRVVATVAFSVGTVVLFSALVSPGGLYPAVQGCFIALGRTTGRGLTWLTLVPLFYVVFLPFGLLMRRGRADRLKRYFDRDVDTYWEPHQHHASANTHERQY